jgi:FKBP-type peptidyl-prolyl cis-trans isomerase FklB
MLSAMIVTAQTSKPKSSAKQPVKTNTVKGPVLKTALDSFSYAMGLSLGRFCDQQNIKTLNTSMVLKGLGDRTKTGNSAALLSDEQINRVIQSYLSSRKPTDAAATQAAANARAAGQKFLAENAKKSGVVTTPSGLQYLVLKAGTDTTHPKTTDVVKCHYHGTLIDGTVFESSYQNGQPIEIGVTQVISGWIEALQMMTPGSKWRLFIPADLAYGDQQAGPKIAPGSTLIFDLELLEIVKQ